MPDNDDSDDQPTDQSNGDNPQPGQSFMPGQTDSTAPSDQPDQQPAPTAPPPDLPEPPLPEPDPTPQPTSTPPDAPLEPPPADEPAPQPAPEDLPSAALRAPQTPQLPEAPFASQFAGGAPAQADTQLENQPDAVSWQASEYIHHQKSSSWYFGFAGVVIILASLLFWLLRDIFSVVVLVLMAGAVATVAGRKPQVKDYHLSLDSLQIGQKVYDLAQFRSFSLVNEGGLNSVNLAPTKRFMPPISLYFAPEDGAKITDILGAVLPFEDHQPDFVDKLLRAARF